MVSELGTAALAIEYVSLRVEIMMDRQTEGQAHSLARSDMRLAHTPWPTPYQLDSSFAASCNSGYPHRHLCNKNVPHPLCFALFLFFYALQRWTGAHPFVSLGSFVCSSLFCY